jgi:phage baseplate assembly protein W
VKAIAIPFRLSGRTIASTDNYYDIVRGQVIDGLMTNQGERVFKPRYGCDIQAALFDPRDELVRRDAASLLQQRLSGMVPRAVVRAIEVEAPGANTEVYINIRYRASALADEVTLSVPVAPSEFFSPSRRNILPGDVVSNELTGAKP